MSYHTTDTVCAIAGILPATLRNWRRAGLIAAPDKVEGYGASQITRILNLREMSAEGATLSEIRLRLHGKVLSAQSGWQCRQEELIEQLRHPSDELLQNRIRQVGTDYSSDDFVNCYLRPLNLWLRDDKSPDAALRLERFHRAVYKHACRVIGAAYRRKTVPMFLEAISVTDPTEIWMEAIRLTGQGCRLEVSPQPTGIPANAGLRYEHHLMRCGAGISQLMLWNYRHRLRDGLPVRLSGPDQNMIAPGR